MNNKAIYFSHDTNASNDPKMVNLRVCCGWEGIGIYWAIIETLHKEKTGELSKDLIHSLLLDFCQNKEEMVKKVENALYATALLIECDGNATSKRVKENLNEINSKSEIGRENAYKRWRKPNKINKNDKNANPMPRQCQPNAIKEKKRKEIYIAETSSAEFNSNSYIDEMIKNKQRHITIIGNYFKGRNINFPSKKAAQDEINRWVKDSRKLAEYTDDDIKRAYNYVSEKFPDLWNLSTIAKYINN